MAAGEPYITAANQMINNKQLLRLLIREDANGKPFFKKNESLSLFDPATITALTAMGIANDATVYFSGTDQEITGAEYWTELDKYILDLKGIGAINATTDFFSVLAALHLSLGDTAAMRLVNAANPGTYDISFSSGWTHDPTGSWGNGTTSFATFGLAPTDLDKDNFFLFKVSAKRHGLPGCPLGAASAGEGAAWGFLPNYQGLFFATVDQYDTYDPDSSGVGMYAINRPNSTHTESYRRGVRVGNYTQSAATGITAQFTYGAMNAAGTKTRFSSDELQVGGVMTRGLTQAEVLVFQNITHAFNKALNRAYRIAEFEGDSVTYGIGPTNASYQWTSIVCGKKGWVENNQGIAGATLENSTPYNPLGAANMSERAASVSAYSEWVADYIFICHGINDCGVNVAGYNTTLFGSQSRTARDYIHNTKGYPFANIVYVCGFYTTELSWADYIVFLPGTVTVAADNARYATFIAEQQDVADEEGIIMVNPFADMAGTGADGRHPNDAKSAVIANTSVLPAITAMP